MINPQFKATVPRSVVLEMIKDLLYISIDQRLKVIEASEDAEELAPQRKYLQTC